MIRYYRFYWSANLFINFLAVPSADVIVSTSGFRANIMVVCVQYYNARLVGGGFLARDNGSAGTLFIIIFWIRATLASIIKISEYKIRKRNYSVPRGILLYFKRSESKSVENFGFQIFSFISVYIFLISYVLIIFIAKRNTQESQHERYNIKLYFYLYVSFSRLNNKYYLAQFTAYSNMVTWLRCRH